MIREIGSEFWSVSTGEDNTIFSDDTKWFLSGRSAQQAIIKDIKIERDIHSVAMPDWCCESMILPFLKEDIEVVFYPAMQPIQNIKTDTILVMDYFGYTGHSDIRNYKGIVIRDLTHSLFSKHYTDADYYFGSLRKWSGFWTGGYARGFKNTVKYSDDDLGYAALREKAMKDKNKFLHDWQGKNRFLHNKFYLKTFEKAEKILDRIGVLSAAPRDIELVHKLDVNLMKEQRRMNARVLLSAFFDTAIFPEIKSTDCPMFVPIRVKNRNELRRYLIQHDIYCPVHWPKSQYHILSAKTEILLNEELSLVCDQRYTEEDMYRIIESIKEFERSETQC